MGFSVVGSGCTVGMGVSVPAGVKLDDDTAIHGDNGIKQSVSNAKQVSSGYLGGNSVNSIIDVESSCAA